MLFKEIEHCRYDDAHTSWLQASVFAHSVQDFLTPMTWFKSYDSLRLFTIVARHLSFTAAGRELNLTKGAVSYQVKQLEREIGFALFERVHNGIVLTEKGLRLQHVAHQSFTELEREIRALQTQTPDVTTITIGASTYFFSRWLSPRLMDFMAQHPNIRLRLQPIIGLGNLQTDQTDLMIRWGKADWHDLQTEVLFPCPAIATAGPLIAQQIAALGLAKALPNLTLLHDQDGSIAWEDWYNAAGLPYRPKQTSLVIPDPNVRVQAVINGQGIALNDALINDEFGSGRLTQISSVALDQYGYFLAYAKNALANPALNAFHDWILSAVD